MRPWIIAEQFRLVAAGDPAFSALACLNFQSGQFTLPCVIFEARARSLDQFGKVDHFELTIVVESEAHDTSGATHDAAVELVRSKFLDHRATVEAAVNAAGVITISPHLGAVSADPALESNRFRTPLAIGGIATLV